MLALLDNFCELYGIHSCKCLHVLVTPTGIHLMVQAQQTCCPCVDEGLEHLYCMLCAAVFYLMTGICNDFMFVPCWV